MAKTAWRALLGSILLALAGCGDSDNKTLVEGNISFQEEPVPMGAIRFITEDGNVEVAGIAVKDGKYSVRVPRGRMKVVITSPKIIGKTKLYDTPDSPERSVTVENLPPKYNRETELRLDVQGSRMNKDWELSK